MTRFFCLEPAILKAKAWFGRGNHEIPRQTDVAVIAAACSYDRKVYWKELAALPRRLSGQRRPRGGD